MRDIPADATSRTPEQHARWILAYTLDWHRRELKSVWWEYFRLSDLTVDELLDERAALSRLEFVQEVGGTKKAPIHRYRFPERQTIRSSTCASGSGLRFLAVAHEGNQSSAPEEADRIRALVDDILRAGGTWIDSEGKELSLETKDILIIAPYNAQVFELQARLPVFRIGTVDKFQGQQAPIVIYSMTTSTHARCAARYGVSVQPESAQRCDIARQCLCILVGSPALFEPECKTPRQMQLANAFCRYLEIAQAQTPDTTGTVRR